MRENNDKLQWT